MSNTNVNNAEETTPQLRAMFRITALFNFLKMLLQSVGMFVLGIIVGMGIVLKNPMPVKTVDKKEDVKVIDQLPPKKDTPNTKETVNLKNTQDEYSAPQKAMKVN